MEDKISEHSHHFLFSLLVDRVIPEFSNCPNDITQQANFNQNFVTINWPEPTASDNVPGTINVVRTMGSASGSSFPAGQSTTITYTATDAAGNIAICSFTITITRPGKGKPSRVCVLVHS